MTNNISIIFDNSDLHIQENLTPSNIKIFFGVNDEIPTNPCDNTWTEIDGNIVNLDCSCTESWFDDDGDKIDLNLDCSDQTIKCDYKWKDIPSGESIDFNCPCPILWTDTNDFNIDCGSASTNDLGRFVLGTGEAVKFEISGLEIYTASSGESISADLKENRTIFDLFTVGSGEGIPNFDFYRSREFNTAISEGQVLTPNIKFASTATFDVSAASGENITSIVLNTNDSLNASFNDDNQTVNFDLKTYPSALLSVDVADGHTLTVTNLTTNVIFSPIVQTGEDVLFTLDKPYNPNIDVLVDENGEAVDVVLNIDPTLLPYNINHGEGASFDLSTTYSLYPVKYESGEDVFITMYESQNHTFISNTTTGEAIIPLNVSTTTGFNVSFCEGQCTNFNIEYDPYTGFPSQVDAGEALTMELYRSRTFYPDDITIGESASAVLSTYPYQQISVNLASGENSTFKLTADIRLEEFYALSGEKLTTVLDELENYKAASGESVDINLATDVALTFDNINQGENVSSDFKPGLPSYLSFTASNGESIYSEVKTLHSYNLSVSFSIGERVYPNDWVNEPILIDLDDRTCCDIMLGDLRNVEMDLAPYNHTSYDTTFKMCELMTFELSSRRALSFTAASGESMTYDNNINTFSFNVYEGHSLSVPNFRTISTIDLEDGNQNPENPVIDIDRPEIPNEMKYIMMGTGERASATLSASFALNNADCRNGEHMMADILYSPPFGFRIQMGEYVETVLNTTMSISNQFKTGEQIQMSFYEPPYNGASGESMTCSLETKSDYYAEFVTEGCLNNDYQDIDPESGQPLPQEYNGTSVEGEMFSKYVVGRCF